mgnify:FL=1
MRLDRRNEAITAYRQALVIDDTYELAWSNLGNAYLLDGYFGQARRAYEKVLELRPGYTDALHGLGNVALQEGAHQEALDFYRAVLQSDTSYVSAHYGMAMAYRGLGDSVRAVTELRAFKKKQIAQR